MLERVLDIAADELGLAPEEIRRRNFVRPDDFPWETHAGATYDSGDYDLPLTEALRIVDADAVRAEQARRRAAATPHRTRSTRLTSQTASGESATCPSPPKTRKRS